MDTLICEMRSAKRSLKPQIFRKNCPNDNRMTTPSNSNASAVDPQDLAVLKITPKSNDQQREQMEMNQQLIQTPPQQLLRPPLPFQIPSQQLMRSPLPQLMRPPLPLGLQSGKLQNGFEKMDKTGGLSMVDQSVPMVPFNGRVSREQDTNIVHPPQSHLDSVNFIINRLAQGKGNGTAIKRTKVNNS